MNKLTFILLTFFYTQTLFARTLPDKNIIPPPLKSGDKVAILSPSYAVSTDRLSLIDSLLKSRGYEPVIYPTATLSPDNPIHGGTARQRAQDLMDAFKDPSIKAIIPTRGGYGASQMLPYLDPKVIHDNPKWLTGYSDISALHAFMNAAGVASIHGAMGNTIASTDSLQQRSFDDMEKILTTSTPMDISIQSSKYNRHGQASGKLLGGNFIVVNNLAQTDWDMFGEALNQPVILFVEEVGEKIYAVERMLHRLNQSGILKNVHGLIFAEFTEYDPDADHSTMEEMISDWLTEYGFPIQGSPIPIIFNFPAGHDRLNLPLVEGVNATLTSTVSGTSLNYKP